MADTPQGQAQQTHQGAPPKSQPGAQKKPTLDPRPQNKTRRQKPAKKYKQKEKKSAQREPEPSTSHARPGASHGESHIAHHTRAPTHQSANRLQTHQQQQPHHRRTTKEGGKQHTPKQTTHHATNAKPSQANTRGDHSASHPINKKTKTTRNAPFTLARQTPPQPNTTTQQSETIATPPRLTTLTPNKGPTNQTIRQTPSPPHTQPNPNNPPKWWSPTPNKNKKERIGKPKGNTRKRKTRSQSTQKDRTLGGLRAAKGWKANEAPDQGRGRRRTSKEVVERVYGMGNTGSIVRRGHACAGNAERRDGTASCWTSGMTLADTTKR
ncbi:hypothetical protein BDN71DRAFT_1436332 [Pleurotus eryngii]|uniref:Uncharacterized protein n=1 Tax=Pleurotus eryngii TaxID=5323 RepID=A0A9P5ZKU4_PLEER|nr:hypothetical protein BDN71DRAFT_1436332 [Pleurotus eryngii]